jgi:hypothetical protein
MKMFKIYTYIFGLLGITLIMLIIPSIRYKYLETYTTNSILGGKITALQTYLDNLSENINKIISNFQIIYMNNNDILKPGTLIYNLYQDMVNIKSIINAINNSLQLSDDNNIKLIDTPDILKDRRWMDIVHSINELKMILNKLQTNINTYLEMVPDQIPSSYTTIQIETIPLIKNLKLDINIVNNRITDLFS